ncbi:PilN domain-containing protein [Silanimonas algicola]
MARINLLPWRAERRKQRQKDFVTMLGGALVVGVALVFAGSWYYDQQLAGQTGRNDFLKQRIEEAKAQNKEIEEVEARKASLLQRKEVIEELQADRSQNVRLFEELVRTIPDGVRLVTIKQAGQQLTLTGRSQSESRVSAYMRNLEASGLINNPRLSIIKAGETTQGGGASPASPADRSLPFGFEMTVTLRSPSDEAAAEEAASGGTPTNAPAAAPGSAPAAAAQAS